MKDKDRYKRAFNTLVSSNVFENEEDILKMTETNKVKKGFFKASTVAAALLAVLLVGSVTVYAADLGGIRTKINAFFEGKDTEMTLVDEGSGIVAYDADGKVIAGTYGDVAADEFVESMNSEVSFGYAEKDGKDSLLLYYKDLSFDIQDDLDAGARYFKLTASDRVLYIYVELDAAGRMEKMSFSESETFFTDRDVTEYVNLK